MWVHGVVFQDCYVTGHHSNVSEELFLLLGHETAFRFDSFLQVKGASAPKLNVRINPQNLMNLENPHSKKPHM